MEWSEAAQAYVLNAGVVCFPMRWSLKEKHGMSMGCIHRPVVTFNTHFAGTAGHRMANLKAIQPMWRANWGVFNDLDGPLDLHSPTGHLDRPQTRTEFKGAQTGRELVFRAEYQTLRRLPRSGGIAFSIRSYQRYLSAFEKLPAADAEALAAAIHNLDPDMALYKNAHLWADAAVAYLSRAAAATRWRGRRARATAAFPSPAVLPAVLAVLAAATAGALWLRSRRG
jgi:hypothetical protein